MADTRAAEQIPKITPPYLSSRTLRNFLDSMKANGVPGRVDRSVLKNLSGGAQTALLGALRFFDLVGPDDAPTKTLETLVNAEGDDRNALTRELLRTHYPFMYPPAFNLGTATMRMVRERFEETFGGGDTARKAMVFFLATAKDAGVPLSPFVRVREVNRPAGAGRRRANGKGAADAPPSPTPAGPPPPQRTAFEMLIGILDPKAMDEQEQAAVWTLMKYLKKRGQA